ncbi:MAG: GNAT family N-acetyltransferase [Planctomycetota bacterium]
MGDITITNARSDDPDLLGLIARHRDFCVAHTPTGSGHAIDPEEVSSFAEASVPGEDVRYWLARSGEHIVGCIGLRAMDSAHAEIKTLHVLPEARGRRIGERLIEKVLNVAKGAGVKRLSLETGRSDGFAPSRALYAKMNFDPCEPFGAYVGDPFSYCMSKEIEP